MHSCRLIVQLMCSYISPRRQCTFGRTFFANFTSNYFCFWALRNGCFTTTTICGKVCDRYKSYAVSFATNLLQRQAYKCHSSFNFAVGACAPSLRLRLADSSIEISNHNRHISKIFAVQLILLRAF